MIEYHQGYKAIKRYGRNSFRPIGKHPFKMIHNARAVKYDLIQQFEASTGIISYPAE
ncbi:Phage protein [Lactococcus lactis subsp. lactis KF147]|nr:Phage protein [Lactococcus lactis subsp. lactis KF147]